MPTCVRVPGDQRLENQSRRQNLETQRGRRQSPSKRAARARSQGPPTGRGAAERAEEARAAATATGLPRASPPPAAGARHGPGTRRRRPAQGSWESPRRPFSARARGAPSAGRGRCGVREPRARREVWAEPSPSPARPRPAPASRPRPRPGARLPRRSGSGEPRGPSCGSRGEHQPPLRELFWLHHAGAGHRDRGASPALRGLRVSSVAPRAGRTYAGTHRTSLSAPQLCLSCRVPPGPGF